MTCATASRLWHRSLRLASFQSQKMTLAAITHRKGFGRLHLPDARGDVTAIRTSG